MSGARLAVAGVIALAVGLVPVSGLANKPSDGAARCGARAAFAELGADSAPDSPLVADRLFEAARDCEDDAQPARALELYDRVARDYPDSRVALAAERRAAALRAMIVSDRDAALLGRFLAIQQQVPHRTTAASILSAEVLLEDAGDWPGAAQVRLWLGDTYRRTGEPDRARDHYLAVADGFPASEHAFTALRAAGDLALARGDFDEAAALFERLDAAGDPARALSRREAFERLDRARLRSGLYIAALAVLALTALGFLVSLRVAAGGWRASLAALWPPPTEVVYLAPLVGLLTVAALTGHEAIAPAVTLVAGGGLAVTWLSSAALSRGQPRWRAAVHAGACVLAVISLVYVALHRTGLVDLILDTVRFGPDV